MLDLKSAFHKIPSDNELKQYIASSVAIREFEYSRLTFGLVTSPSLYKGLISSVFQNLLGAMPYCYVDEIIVVYRNNHSEHLQQDFDILKQALLTLKLEHCALI